MNISHSGSSISDSLWAARQSIKKKDPFNICAFWAGKTHKTCCELQLQAARPQDDFSLSRANYTNLGNNSIEWTSSTGRKRGPSPLQIADTICSISMPT